MLHDSDLTLLHRLLATRYDPGREEEAIAILAQHPEVARLEWPGPDEKQPFIKGSTALHYAANDGKLRLMQTLIDLGADVNASNASWYRSVLAWAANNSRIDAVKLLLAHGAKPDSLDAMHAAAWGGPEQGRGRDPDYAETLRLLIDAGADINDRRYCKNQTPLAVALESGNTGAIELLRSMHASET